jgi:hypothetical protein
VVPATRWTPQDVREKLAPLVVDTAQAISRALGDRRALAGA